MLNCDVGPDAGRNTTRNPNITLPAASIFNPPYPINSGNMQVRAAKPVWLQGDLAGSIARYAGKQTVAEPLTAQVLLPSAHTIATFAKKLVYFALSCVSALCTELRPNMLTCTPCSLVKCSQAVCARRGSSR